MFDYELMKQAEYAGAEYVLNSRALDINTSSSFVELEVKNKETKTKLRSKAAVIATGYNYRLTRKLDLGQPPKFLNGAQAEAAVNGVEQTEIYFGNSIAPGSFAWAIPLKGKRVRIGLTTRTNAAFYLRKFLKSKFFTDRGINSRKAITLDNIALGVIPKTFSSRVLVVGEAAGQVKSTTNGGVFYGLRCSKIAAGVIKKAFRNNDFSEKMFAEYEKTWQKKYGFEIRLGYHFRKIVDELTDEQIEKIFKVSKKRGVISSLRKRSQFDEHKDLILFMLKNPVYRKLIWNELRRMIDTKVLLW
jgi:flavin-dependent dehydrogenase